MGATVLRILVDSMMWFIHDLVLFGSISCFFCRQISMGKQDIYSHESCKELGTID
ncbi:unnamed protein product [Sphenostylis stenocarpa]|uniref:Uncharacterized protein n=1 Tax=Sphenostylis stenocarpa TaxID=92480 RepID=A0AA86VRF3_9FABA|nr:unnamed protein product [Sphenostylis stenocarpa]